MFKSDIGRFVTFENNHFPITFSIGINGYWCAKWQWRFYKYFGIKRTVNCGRTKKTKTYSCYQPIDKEHCYITDSGDEIRCKCCNAVKILSNHPLTLDDLNYPW